MADKQYFVITSTYGGNLVTGNIILLPGGGRLNNADITINDEDLVIAGNYSDGKGNIFVEKTIVGTTINSSSAYIENSISFTNGGRLNLSAQTADRTTDPNQSAYSDSAIAISSTWNHTISTGNEYPSSATYEADMFKSTGGTFSVISDLCGTISQNQSVSLTGLTTKDGNAADNSTGNTIITTAIRANARKWVKLLIGWRILCILRTIIHDWKMRQIFGAPLKRHARKVLKLMGVKKPCMKLYIF